MKKNKKKLDFEKFTVSKIKDGSFIVGGNATPSTIVTMCGNYTIVTMATSPAAPPPDPPPPPNPNCNDGS